MTTEIQTTQQDAMDQLVNLPPALVEEIIGNAESIQPMARGMAAINLYNLFARVQESNSNKDRLELQALLNKMTGIEKAQVQQSGAGPQVIINITRAKDDSKDVIEGVAVKVEPAEE